MITRRQFVKTATGCAAAPLLPGTVFGGTAGGRQVEPHFFVFVQVYGAWDVCLAFDPKDRDALLPSGERQYDQPYSMADVREYANGIRLPPDGQILGSYADRLSIVNGIDMAVDNGHLVDAMMSGFQSPRVLNLPYLQSVLAKRHPYLRTCSLPHLYASYDGQFFEGPLLGSSITATGRDFVAIVASSSKPGGMEDVQTMTSEYRNRQDTLERRRAYGTYVDALGRAVAVGQRLRDSGFNPPDNVTSPDGFGTLLGQLFASGVLGAATISPASGSFGSPYFFDTHSDHYRQHPIKRLLTDVDGLCRALAKVKLDEHTSVFERTTVILAAEFCRTPRLNGSQGKDHNFHTNSAAIIGYGARPGMFGISGAKQEGSGWLGHAALPISFATGQPRPSGHVLSARNLWAGLGGVAGVDLTREFGTDTSPIQFLG